MASIKELLNRGCKTKLHDFFNLTRGMIDVYNSEISYIKSFESGSKTEYPIESVQEATWVTPRNLNAKAFVVSFTSDDIPSHLHIVGEYTNTKVYPMTDRPMQCKKCQKYGHMEKRCSLLDFICGSCAGKHKIEECKSMDK